MRVITRPSAKKQEKGCKDSGAQHEEFDGVTF